MRDCSSYVCSSDLSSDFIRSALAKGLRPSVVLFQHSLRNAIIPVVSVSAVQFGFMLGCSIVIETIFAINGLVHLAWESITRSDFQVMQAIVLLRRRCQKIDRQDLS